MVQKCRLSEIHMPVYDHHGTQEGPYVPRGIRKLVCAFALSVDDDGKLNRVTDTIRMLRETATQLYRGVRYSDHARDMTVV